MQVTGKLDAAAAGESPPQGGRPRRVLFIAGRTAIPDGVIPPHGSGAHVAATRAGLEARFEVVTVLDLPQEGAAAEPPSRLRRYVPARVRGLRQDVLLLARERRLAARALGALSGSQPDVVYERDEYLSFAGLQVARKLGVPYVLEVNGLLVDEIRTQYRSLAEPLGLLLERLKRACADAIVVESPGMALALERDGAAPSKLVVAPNALPAARVRTTPRPVRSDQAVVGWIGHLMPWYVEAIAFLLDAAPAVVDAFPNVRFEIVAGGLGAARLEALAEARGLRENFRFRPAVPHKNVPTVLEEFDIGVIPAIDDYRFPIKLVEMGGAGLPVIAPSTTAIDGLLRRGIEYEPFEPGDADDLARALVRLITDLAHRDALGRALHDAVRTRFTWGSVSAQLASAIDLAIDARR